LDSFMIMCFHFWIMKHGSLFFQPISLQVWAICVHVSLGFVVA
jgi:hypothetical protein